MDEKHRKQEPKHKWTTVKFPLLKKIIAALMKKHIAAAREHTPAILSFFFFILHLLENCDLTIVSIHGL